MEGGVDECDAKNLHRIASCRIQTVLALEVSAGTTTETTCHFFRECSRPVCGPLTQARLTLRRDPAMFSIMLKFDRSQSESIGNDRNRAKRHGGSGNHRT